MSSLANSLTSSNVCRDDLNKNVVIRNTLLALRAYSTLYTATCLKNPDTSAYCYAEAITNASNPTDTYLYFLPLNTSLSAGAKPSCGSCTRNIMGVFEEATSNRSSIIASTYESAASQINIQCGPDFVNAALAPPTSDSHRVVLSTSVLAIALMSIMWLF